MGVLRAAAAAAAALLVQVHIHFFFQKRQDSVAGFVIQASGMPDFEDFLWVVQLIE